MNQVVFFHLREHLKRLSDASAPMEALAGAVDIEAFRPVLEIALDYSDGSKGGGRPMTLFPCSKC